jgi:hypothetical protein
MGIFLPPDGRTSDTKTPSDAFAFYQTPPNLSLMKTLFASLLMSLIPFFGNAA